MRLKSRVGPAVLVAGLWLALTGGLLAEALDVPPLTGRIVDLAGVLPPAVAEQLSADLQAHEAKTSNQVAVLIAPSLEGEPLFDLSHRVATTWKLGRKGTDNGALLLIAIKDRKVRVEVGYGLEGVLTDAKSAQIIRNEMVPRFRTGDFPGGITAGVQAILKTIEGTYSAPERPATSSPSSDTFGNVVFAVILGVVIGLLLSRMHRLLGPVAAGGLSFLAAPWVIPALFAGAVSVALVGLLSALGQGSGSGRRRDGNPFDGTWFSTQNGGWGSGGMGGSFGGSGGFSGGGGDFGGEGQVAIGNRSTLTPQERAQIEAAVQAAEQHTSAEIVPMIVEQSGLYREARHRAGLVVALLVLTALLTIETAWLPWGWHAANAVWLLAATMLAYGIGVWAGTWPVIIRFLTSRERMRQKVQLRAERAFAQHGIALTRERTGLLLMVSLLERQVYVLADQALREGVSTGQWSTVVAVIVERMRADDLVGGLCRGIEASGVLLARACPPRKGDNPNELSNDVIQDA